MKTKLIKSIIYKNKTYYLNIKYNFKSNNIIYSYQNGNEVFINRIYDTNEINIEKKFQKSVNDYTKNSYNDNDNDNIIKFEEDLFRLIEKYYIDYDLKDTAQNLLKDMMKPVYEKVKRSKVKYKDFGNIDKYPVIKSLVDILNEINKKSYTDYCKTVLNKYNKMIHIYNKNITYEKQYKYTLKLLKDEYIRNINSSSLPINLKTHMYNLISALYKNNIL